MEITKKEQTLVFNRNNITAYEYPTQNKLFSNNFIKIKGRHPVEGWMYNEVCTESICITKGSVTLTTKDGSFELNEMDTAIISPNERYFFDGDCELWSPSSPPFYPEQNKIEK